jgi:hypothetical protein
MKKSDTRFLLFIAALLVIIIFVVYYYYNLHQYESMDESRCINIDVYNKQEKKNETKCIKIAKFKDALNYAYVSKPKLFLNYLVTYSSNEGPLNFKKIGEKYNINISSNPINDKPEIKKKISEDLASKNTRNAFFNYLLNKDNDGVLRFQLLSDDFNITSDKNPKTYKNQIDSLLIAPEKPPDTGYKYDYDKEEWVERKTVNDEWTPKY